MRRAAPPTAPARVKIGAMARRCGVSHRTLRYYEELGLLTPQRSAGGVRLYSDSDLATIRRILRRLDAGESLGSIGLAETRSAPIDPRRTRRAQPAAPAQRKRKAGKVAAALVSGRGHIKIGDLARHLQTTVRTLRYYEEEGIIAASRSQGGTRLFSADELDACRTALSLARIGIGLDTVKKLATGRKSCKTGDEAARLMLGILEKTHDFAMARLARFDALRKDIDRVRGYVRRCRGCRNPPNRNGCPDCPMERNRDRSELAKLIWDR